MASRSSSSSNNTMMVVATMNGTTPLLKLLDGVLSQDVERVKMSVSETRTLLLLQQQDASRSNFAEDMMTTTSSLQVAAVSQQSPLLFSSILLPPLEQEEQVLLVSSSNNDSSAAAANNNNDNADTTTDERVAIQLLQSIPLLVSLIQQMLHVFPQWAQTCSALDESLPLHFAASLGIVGVADVLFNHYPQAACTANAKGKIPLHYAARENKVNLVEFLLTKSPQTAAIASKKDKLALHFSSGEGNTQVVQLLLHAYPKGASLPSAKGKVPLHFAARWGHLDIAAQLLHLFSDGIRAMDWEGSLPLHDAARQGQFEMAEFLVQQFPVALCVQNLRGEVPLFPAARSGNVDLVAYLVQAWPQGSKLVLKSISKDDLIDTWSWDIVELLLRGAIHHLDVDDCAVLQGRESPTLRLIGDDVVNATAAAAASPATSTAAAAASSPDGSNMETNSTSGKMKNKKKKGNIKDYKVSGTIEDRQARLVDTTAHGVVVIATNNTNSNTTTTTTKKSTRSKSPILDELNTKKRSLSASSSSDYSASNKRILQRETLSRTSSTDSDETVNRGHHVWHAGTSTSSSSESKSSRTPIVLWESPQAEKPQDGGLDQKFKPTRAPRRFLHLHAALQSGASIHVVDHVLQMRPQDIQQMDENHCYPLHWAVAWAKTEEQVNLVLDKIFRPFPRAALQRTWFENQLPLHIALKSIGGGTNNTITSKTEADSTSTAASERIIKALLQEHPASAVHSCQTRDEWHDQKPLHMACRYDCSVGTLYELLRVDPSLLPSSSSSSVVTQRNAPVATRALLHSNETSTTCR